MATILKGKNANKPHTVRYWVDGKQREKSFKLAKDARDFMAKVEHDTRAGIFQDPTLGNVTFVDYANQVLANRGGMSPGTLALYRSVLSAWVGPWANGRTIAKIANDREGATDLVNSKMVNGAGELLSKNRRQLALSLITLTLDEAMHNDRIVKHGMTGIQIKDDNKVSGDRTDFIFPTYAQIQTLADGMNGYALAVWLMRACGLRISESLAVHREHFTHNGTVLRLRQQSTNDGKSAAPLKGRKDGEYREIPVPSYLWAMVRDLPNGPLMPATNGNPYFSYQTVHEAFKKSAANAGIPAQFTPHSLRHLFATKLLGSGVSLTTVSKWLGHRDTRITSKVYAHVLHSDADDARKILDAEFDNWIK